MAKTTPPPPAADITPPTPRIEALRLGQTVTVRVAEGMTLINGETGAPFEPGVATPQVVTLTTLRRLRDGDLLLG